MEETKNLAELHKEISEELLDSIRMLDILSDISSEPKENTLINLVLEKVNSAFDKTSECRKMIFICD